MSEQRVEFAAMELWKPTELLRLLRKKIEADAYKNRVAGHSHQPVLQQLWVSDRLNSEWRDVEVVLEP